MGLPWWSMSVRMSGSTNSIGTCLIVPRWRVRRRVGIIDVLVRLIRLRANLRWLSGYRHPRVLRVGLVEQLAEVFARVRPLMAGVLAVGTPLTVDAPSPAVSR